MQEYWIVDPINRIIWVMLLRDGTLVEQGAYGEGDTVTSTALEGFSVSLDEVFGGEWHT